MKRILYLLFLGCLVYTCDDGDIFEVTLEFDQELELCIDANDGNYLLYDTKTSPAESLSLLFRQFGNDDIFNPPSQDFETILTINSQNNFNYRRYNGDPANFICAIIPDPGVTISEDYSAASGAEAILVSSFEDDDNDGILSIYEGRGEPDENGEYPDAIDTDGDGIPNYIDQDDDNDNVPTIEEAPDEDGDGNPSDAQNTDFDAEMTAGTDIIPDYLDNDDDGDGTLTINEDEDSDGELFNDFDETATDPNLARFLNEDAVESFTPAELADNEYTRTVTVSVMIVNANIGIANIQDIDMGTYTLELDFPED